MPDLTPIEAKPKERVRTLEPIVSVRAPRREGESRVAVGAILSGPIFSRARDIIAANVNDLLDRSEDPAKMIRMMILEMEDVLSETRATAARAIADLKEMRATHDRLDDMATSWDGRAMLALEKDREDLARQALMEKSRITDMIDGLAAEMSGIEEALKGYEADIQRLQAKLSEARARQVSIATRIERAMSRTRTSEMLYGHRTEDAFSRFEEMERQADLAEGAADAAALGGKSLEEEIAELKAAEKVDSELAKLKDERAKRQQGDNQ
ncbi:PspA/IM30 family protein [Sphingomicrobium sp. XHP0235]|uniref:PspA/IM30 family protein n=1 Tax=Sphingomicrobium aquimarinum TaxID=3133971 RepID=UPI0031FED869